MKKRKINWFYVLFPITVYLFFFAAAASQGSDEVLIAIHLVLNFYILGMGIFSLVQGIKERNSGSVNGGILTITLLIALRFVFVEDFLENLIVRGVIFILLGCAFLGANYLISQKLKKEAANE